MAYTVPTSATLKARYPEFKDVPEALIDLFLAEAVSDVGDTWLEKDRARAQLLLTAHKLTIEGEPERSLTGVGSAGTGQIKRDKVGDAETEFSGSGAGVVASAQTLGLSDTAYGMEFMRIQRKNFPAVGVV